MLDTNAPAPVAEPVTPAVEESGSLADHEAAHGPDAGAEPATETPAAPAKRTRHRAASQQASPEDVGRIAELTKRLRETEAERDALRAPRPASATPQAPQSTPPTTTPPSAATAEPFKPRPFVAFDAWLEQNAGAEYEDYIDARTEDRFAQIRAHERQQEAAQAQQRTHVERRRTHDARLASARERYADFDTAIANPASGVSPVMFDAMLQSEHSAEIHYFLGKHPDISTQIMHDSAQAGPESVAVMRRYLESLVASTATPSHATPSKAVTTGAAALALVPPAPQPPTPVRTSALKPGNEPPGDDSMSISDHETHYGYRRR
jgi:hypothetical protein